MSWKNQLKTAAFRGVEFQSLTIDDQQSDRRIVSHKYPYRDGADHEDLGREPRITRIKAFFFGNNHETELGQLLHMIDDGVPGLFEHPLFGSWQARIIRSPTHMDTERFDYVSVDLEIHEDGTNSTLADMESIPVLTAKLDAAIEGYTDASDLSTYEEQDYLAAIEEFASSARSFGSGLANKVAQMRSKAGHAIEAVRKALDPNSYAIVKAVKDTSFWCQKIAGRLSSEKPPLTEFYVWADISAGGLAHRLYGNSARKSEITSLNKVRNPFVIKAGTTLKVYSR